MGRDLAKFDAPEAWLDTANVFDAVCAVVCIRILRQYRLINTGNNGTAVVYGTDEDPRVALQETRPVDRHRVPSKAADACVHNDTC